MEKGVCPICGSRNGCYAVAGKDPYQCWCTKVVFNREILKEIPDKFKDISCVCPKCNKEFGETKKIKKVFDLHSHSTASDGSLTPTELVKRAKSVGLLGFALTDHDTVCGLTEANHAAKEENIELINGIELSTSIYGRDVHILGYFLNLEDEEFIKNIEDLKSIREERNIKLIEKLNKNRINITLEDVKNEAKGEIISRLHIAKALIAKGAVYSVDEAFRNYLGKNGLAFVEKENFTPSMGVSILKKNKALISWAHPHLYSKKPSELEAMILELKPLGLGALEVEYPNMEINVKRDLIELARKHDLLITGGSDYHGENRDNINIGDYGLNYSEFLLLKEER